MNLLFSTVKVIYLEILFPDKKVYDVNFLTAFKTWIFQDHQNIK